MKAAFTDTYGPASSLTVRETPKPTLASPNEVLVEVHASPVTAGDLRLRAADFPGFTALPGRLMLGIFRPRNPVQGTMFAGRVVAVGSAVTRYAAGDDVFGAAARGAYAEYLVVPEGGAMAHMPTDLTYAQAAAVPYGGGTARHFLRDVGGVQPGDEVLIIGASGGVGRFAVQLAKHMGARVTGVSSRQGLEQVRSLGADVAVDYEAGDYLAGPQRYDVILDTSGRTRFSRCRGALTETGRYLTLLATARVRFYMALTAILGGKRAKVSVALNGRKELEELRALVEQGAIRPVVARSFPMDQIAAAHALAETPRVHGCVVVSPQPLPSTDIRG